MNNDHHRNYDKKANHYSKNCDSQQFKKHRPIADFTLEDLVKGKQLDLVAAALLLTGKLKVDSVELFRDSPIVGVSLLGKFPSNKKKRRNPMVDFLLENGNLTFEDVFEAFQERMNRGDNT